MTLPRPIEALWSDLQSMRGETLKEVEGLSQAQADWRPSAQDWSIGEIVHHLTLAEVNTGKLTSKLFKEAGDRLPSFPADYASVPPLPPSPPGPAEAPPVVRPTPGQPLSSLLAEFRAARERSRQSVERLGGADPRGLRFPHPRLGDLDLAQWWLLQARHDENHLRQLRAVKAAAGFPGA